MKDAARNVPAALQDAVQGSVFEYSPAISAFVEAVSGRLQAETGYALIIDYGHDQSGLGDTLQAVRDHLYHPALSEPGSADLTAHVDFSAAKGIFQANNIQTFGPAGQGAFLTSLGIRERTETLCRNATADQARILRSGTDRLVAANRMGTLFRVMVAASEGLPPPPGFEAQEDIEC